MKRKVIALVPDYMQNFSCIASKCEDNCCSANWDVMVDRFTYKKYNSIKDGKFKQLFDIYVKRNRQNPSDERYARIEFKKGKGCPFLSDDKLCTIQLAMGEESLSQVCAVYPRIINQINNKRIEMSTNMSCPQAARLALLKPKGIRFVENEESFDTRWHLFKVLDTESEQAASKPERYFDKLRDFTIEVLQNRSYNLADRLIIIGMFYRKAQEYVDSNRAEEIPQLIGYYTDLVRQESMGESLTKIQTQYTIQIQLLKQLADVHAMEGVSNSRYLECYSEFMRGIKYKDGADIEGITERYIKAYQKYYRPFMDQHEYILENYLVNYVFKNLFPFRIGKSLFDEYVMLVIHYALIKMHLIGMAGFHKGLDLDIVIRLVQAFSKIAEHIPTYLDAIIKGLHEMEYASMAHMAILIKN